MNRVVIVSLNSKYRFYEEKIKKITKRILQLLKKKNCYLEIFLISSQRMKFLNKKFRGPARLRHRVGAYGASKNKVPNILSFKEPKNFPHPESELKPLGEIYLNAEASSFKLQASSLLAHGLLHLLGYQHQRKNDRIKIERKEQEILKKLEIRN